jgi:hypothetical protein
MHRCFNVLEAWTLIGACQQPLPLPHRRSRRCRRCNRSETPLFKQQINLLPHLVSKTENILLYSVETKFLVQVEVPKLLSHPRKIKNFHLNNVTLEVQVQFKICEYIFRA